MVGKFGPVDYEEKFPVVTELDSIMTRVGLGISAFLGPFFNKQTNVNVCVLKITFYDCTGICCLVTKMCRTLLQLHRLWPTRLLHPRDFPGKSTGVGCHFLLQGIFLTQGLNARLSPALAGRFLTTESEEKPVY